MDLDLWGICLEAYDEDPGAETSQPSPADSEPYLLGFVLVNIVGLRHYSGTVRGREMVGLVREPLNPFDPNAIKVLNARGVQVGHVERAAAAALAPLLDSRLAFLEAIVPNAPGNRNPFRLPCQVHVFAHPDAIPTVQCAIVDAGLHLISQSDHEFGLSAAAAVQERTEKSKKDKGVRPIDEIFALVGKDESEITPVEPPESIISSELFAHQKEGLGWLVRRENSNDLPPFWEQKDGSFLNVLTNHEIHERPEPLQGGILADDMGLGKTLTLLSLIATNRPGNSKSRKRATGARKNRRIDGDGFVENEILGPKATLVVCPKSVLSTWVTQLEEHTKPGSLRVYLYYQERTKDPDELMKYDIVLTTYNTLAVEFGEGDSPLINMEWLRVILDEAHVIKNSLAKQTKAVIALKAKRRWVVTGTPIQNSSFDLFSFMAFLRFQPFSIKSYWQSLVQRPLEQGHKNGLSRLQALMGTISLRRTKDAQNGNKGLPELPPKTVETCFVELSAEERERYDQMESEVQNTLREYINADAVLHNYSTVLHIILRLRQLCNDVALCPSDIKSLISSNAIEDVSKNPVLLMKLVSMVEDGDDFDCPICLSPPAKTVITRCTHIFCQTCILKILKQPNAHCPLCRCPLSKSDLFMAAPRQSSNDDDSMAGPSERPVSSKVSALLELLLASREHNPSTKSVVFSQFRKMLILLKEPLKAAGFRVLQLDGSLSMKTRTEMIKEFGKGGPNSPTVLLASIKVAGAGINLTAASRVYLVEPWWNPAVEEQAMDRVHRIGQQREVRVVRLIVRNSIEERVLELQDKKKKLASGAFRKKAVKDQAQMHVEDIRTMMRL